MGRKPEVLDRAMTPREKTRMKIARQWDRIDTLNPEIWTEQDCLLVLRSAKYRGSIIDRDAWQRLGRLRGFIKE